MKVTRDDAVAIFAALGYHAAPDWNKKRLTAKLASMTEAVAPEDIDAKVEDKRLKTLAHELLAASDAKETVDVLREAAGAADTEAEPVAKADDAETTTAAKKKPANKPAKKKAADNATPASNGKHPKVEGTDCYVAGQAVATVGLKDKITEEHWDYYKANYGRPISLDEKGKPKTHGFFGAAQHAIRGFLGEAGKGKPYEVGKLLAKYDGDPIEDFDKVLATVSKKVETASDSSARSMLLRAVQAVAGYKSAAK